MPRKSILALALLLVLTAPTGGAVPAHAAPDDYKPRSGPTFNSPLGGAEVRRAIFRKIVRTIDSTKRGSSIKIFTWNLATEEGTTALLRAQARGVRVKLIMDRQNNKEIPNPSFRRLRSGLVKGNADWPAKRRSWARMCSQSCRGAGGASHSKFFLFSEVGKVERVVMQGSANLTVAATNNQWNDMYTYTGNRVAWRFANGVFNEAARDKRLTTPFASVAMKNSDFVMFPLAGKGSYDPVARLLNQVKCRGATNTPGGRTVIRIAPDVMREDRGMRLAVLVRELWNQGCDIKVGYTVMGIDVGRFLRQPTGRGPVPLKHLVQDFDGDGEFDNYFHLKSMSVVGNVRGNRSGYAVLNGSANWSSAAAKSDENVGVYYTRALTLRYQDHINFWYENFPTSSFARPSARSSAGAVAGEQPLVFGSGRNAVYEDGTSAAPGGIDPFASMSKG